MEGKGNDKEKDVKKKRNIVSGFKKKVILPLQRNLQGTKKQEKNLVPSSDNVSLQLQMTHFKITPSSPMMRQRADNNENNAGEGDCSPCNSVSGSRRTSDLFDEKTCTLTSLTRSQGYLKSSRSSSVQSLAAGESRVINTIEWIYKVKGYQDKYHIFAQEMIRENKVANWDGHFPKGSDPYLLLKKMAKSTNLSKPETLIVKWKVLTDIQSEFPSQVVGDILPSLFDKIIACLNENALTKDLLEAFWGSAEKLIEALLWNLVNYGCKRILYELPEISPALLVFTRFSETLQNYLHKPRNNITSPEHHVMLQMDFVKEELSKEFTQGADEWFVSLASLMDDCTLGTSTDLAMMLCLNLNDRKEALSNIFKRWNLNLFDIVYSVWTTKFGELVSPLINYALSRPMEAMRGDISGNTRLDFKGSADLYHLLEATKNFYQQADKPKVFHDLFRPCVPKWLDVNIVRALSQLEKAVAIDDFEVSNEERQTSESAIDAECILQTMDRLFQELNWPDLEDRFTFAILIIKNLDRCIMFYAELIDNRLKYLEKSTFEDFEISDQLCIALNNVEKVRQFAERIVANLDTTSIVDSLAENSRGRVTYQQCRDTPPQIMENLIDNVNRKLSDYFTSAFCNIAPMIFTLLEKAASPDLIDLDPLRNRSISHFNRILDKLKSKLSTEGFGRVFPILWENAFASFAEVVEANIQKKNTPDAFKHLEYLFHCIESLFFPDPNTSQEYLNPDELALLSDVKSQVRLYATPSPRLILEYYQDRLDAQLAFNTNNSKAQSYLTIVPDRSDTSGQLRLQILNGFFPQSCWDCFVKFQVITSNFSEKTRKDSTNVSKRNDYLEFEDIFHIDLTNEEWSQGGIIHFWMKGKSIIRGWNEFLGEAFLSLKDIPIADPLKTPIRNSAQVKIYLSKPGEPNSKYLKVLKSRTHDRFATNFVKLELQRMKTIAIESFVTPD